MSFAKAFRPLFLATVLLPVMLAAATAIATTAADGGFDHSHRAFSELLMQHVRDGRVDYKGYIAAQDRFQRYLRVLGQVDKAAFDQWPRRERMAFWINAYNAFTIQAIVDHYPIKSGLVTGLFPPDNSIRQIPGAWDQLKFAAAGRRVTLDHIEHGILRKEFNEPRIHFALVCASISCPDLRNEAYGAAVLDEQLAEQTRNFLGDPGKGVQPGRNGDTIRISQIFKWFPEDFAGSGTPDRFGDFSRDKAGVLGFILGHTADPRVVSLLHGGDFDLDYLDYDWSLNE